MQKKNLKMLVYALIAAICLSGGVYFSTLEKSNENFLETSVLTILKAVNEDLSTYTPPDLAIEDVVFEKVHDPTSDFNYYKYKADVTIKNYGGTLVNANVILHGDDGQKHSFIRNTSKGFYLQKNGVYVVRDYDVIFDGNYNGGKITLTVDVKDQNDLNLVNNGFTVDVFELPPKVKDISLKRISGENSFVIEFENNQNLKNSNFEIFTTRQYNFPKDSLKYAEVAGNGHVYSYYRTQNNSDIVLSRNWQKISSFLDDELSVKFSENPFTDIDDHYLYLKATSPKNGNYMISNVIKFPRYLELNYGDFSGTFAEYTGTVVANNATLYGDVSPEKIVTRGDVLKTVLDSLNVNISTETKENHFQDVSYENGFLLFR